MNTSTTTRNTPRVNGLWAPYADDLNWKIHRSQIRYATAPNQSADQLSTWKDQHVFVHSETGQPLGTGSKNYKLVQPAAGRDFLARVARDNNAEVDTFGSLKGGSKFFAIAPLDGHIIDIGGDKTQAIGIFSTGCDGSATEGRVLGWRPICLNQQPLINAVAPVYRVTHRSTYNPEECHAAILAQLVEFENYGRNLDKLARKAITSDEAGVILAGLINPKAANFETGAIDGDEMDTVRKGKPWIKLMSLFSGAGMGALQDSSRGTAYGLLQAMTEYYDHHCRARTDENRFISGTYGANATKKQQALETLLTLA